MTTDIYASMRENLIDAIQEKYLNFDSIIEWEKADRIPVVREGWDQFKQHANIPQLWAVYKLLVVRGTKLTMLGLSGTPNDQYCYCNFAGMFVGIETDGYTHS